LWFLFEIFRSCVLLARSGVAQGSALGQAGIAATIGLAVAGLFEFNLGDSEVMMLYLFLIAAGCAWMRLEAGASEKPAGRDSLPRELAETS
jgi:hypothetical protein